MLGLGTGATRVVRYDPRWPRLYRLERQRLQRALGPKARAIEHIGSTAVQGLAAKPILDIMVGVKSFAVAKTSIPPLQRLGYQSRGWFGLPGRWYFVKEAGGRRTHQIHLVTLGGSLWTRHLAFRDYLRRHRTAAIRYGALKRRLAGKFPQHRQAYQAAKHDFIQSLMKPALRP